MSKRIDNLKLLIERTEKCRAEHIESATIHERFEGMPVWDGVVETFQLHGHACAKRAYAWVAPATKVRETEYKIVLGAPPVNSALDAVRAAITSQFKKLVNLAREIQKRGKE